MLNCTCHILKPENVFRSLRCCLNDERIANRGFVYTADKLDLIFKSDLLDWFSTLSLCECWNLILCSISSASTSVAIVMMYVKLMPRDNNCEELSLRGMKTGIFASFCSYPSWHLIIVLNSQDAWKNINDKVILRFQAHTVQNCWLHYVLGVEWFSVKNRTSTRLHRSSSQIWPHIYNVVCWKQQHVKQTDWFG